MKKLLVKYSILIVSGLLVILLISSFSIIVNGVEPLENMHFNEGYIKKIEPLKCRNCSDKYEVDIKINNDIYSFRNIISRTSVQSLLDHTGKVDLHWSDNWFFGKKIKNAKINGKSVIFYNLERLKKFYYFAVGIVIFSFFWSVVLYFYFKKRET